MQNMHELAETLQKMILDWISHSVLSGLDSAIQRTIGDRYFTKSDVEYAIMQLKLSVEHNQLIEWVKRNTEEHTFDSEMISNNRSRRILCLHAGNLPLVGLQDMIAVLLSGAQYVGKISRKDPYLIPSLIKYIQNQSTSFNLRFSRDVSDFIDEQFHEWMFAGSDESLDSLRFALEKDSIISPNNQRYLIRIAHYSVAVMDKWDPGICSDLIESMFRYKGNGCRSVAVIYSKFNLNDLSDELIAESEKWFNINGRPENISTNIQFRSAYNDAVGINQVQLGSSLVQEGIVSNHDPGIIYWQPAMNLNDIHLQHGHKLQQVYFSDFGSLNEFTLVDNWKYDLLKDAQCPPFWWRPDGIDVLNWILTK